MLSARIHVCASLEPEMLDGYYYYYYLVLIVLYICHMFMRSEYEQSN
jgi:hypothetical protein